MASQFEEWILVQCERFMREWITTGPCIPMKIEVEQTKTGIYLHVIFDEKKPKVRQISIDSIDDLKSFL